MEQFQEWADDLKQLQKVTQTLKRSLNKIGGQSDTHTFRNNISTKQSEGNDIINRMAKRINQYKRQSTSTRDGDKLLKQYNDLKLSFEKINDDVNVKTRQYTPAEDATDATYGSGGNAGSAYGAGDGMMQAQSEQELQPVSGDTLSAVALAEERNAQVTKIAQDVVEIKEAFDDLNELVDEQQEHLDQIETNVATTKDEVEAGTAHLKNAEGHQIAARKKMCYIAICLLVIIAIIVIPIVVTSN